jgi:hypothetical protein
MRPKRKFVGTAPYHTFGWMRRRVMDHPDYGYAYEMPEGDLVYTADSRHYYGLKLEIWIDDKGRKFCTLPPQRKEQFIGSSK